MQHVEALLRECDAVRYANNELMEESSKNSHIDGCAFTARWAYGTKHARFVVWRGSVFAVVEKAELTSGGRERWLAQFDRDGVKI